MPTKMIDVEIIRTTGRVEKHRVQKDDAIRVINTLIGCETADTVRLRGGLVMILDDAGWDTVTLEHGTHIEIKPVRPRKPVNASATLLYRGVREPGTTHQIVGDVAIARDADFGDDDDPETLPRVIAPELEERPTATRPPTPWAVICPAHGQQFLTEPEYNRQMDQLDCRWTCPTCAAISSWDDDNYEASQFLDGFHDDNA